VILLNEIVEILTRAVHAQQLTTLGAGSRTARLETWYPGFTLPQFDEDVLEIVAVTYEAYCSISSNNLSTETGA